MIFVYIMNIPYPELPFRLATGSDLPSPEGIVWLGPQTPSKAHVTPEMICQLFILLIVCYVSDIASLSILCYMYTVFCFP